MNTFPRNSACIIAGIVLCGAALCAAPAAATDKPAPAGAAAPAATPAAAASAKGPEIQSERIAQRIDTLLKHRMNPYPLPTILPNPFEVVSGGTSTRTGERSDMARSDDGAIAVKGTGVIELGTETPLTKNADTLARIVSTLKLGGVIRLNDQVQVVINGVPRREGDSIAVLRPGSDAVRIQVVRINAGTFTLRLEEAEQTVKY